MCFRGVSGSLKCVSGVSKASKSLRFPIKSCLGGCLCFVCNERPSQSLRFPMKLGLALCLHCICHKHLAACTKTTQISSLLFDFANHRKPFPVRLRNIRSRPFWSGKLPCGFKWCCAVVPGACGQGNANARRSTILLENVMDFARPAGCLL